MANLVRWTPRRDVRSFDQAFDSLWRDFWNGQSSAYASETARPVLRPALDVIESENAVDIRVDLPGLSPDALNVEVEGDLLTISGELASEIDEENERYHYRERRAGAFKRALRLSETVDAEHIEATYENGVLYLTLPKLPEAQPRQIKVKSA